MTSSLVGSEMCIRDRNTLGWLGVSVGVASRLMGGRAGRRTSCGRWKKTCLLYTSDAADDM
eukprot:650250-Prorocentrum_lima.AAC.1